MFIKGCAASGHLRPHQVRPWLHSPDPQFRAKVRRICDLYLHPPPGAHVVCVDEKTSIQALARRYPGRPAAPGRAARRELEYVRHGTCALSQPSMSARGRSTGSARAAVAPSTSWGSWTTSHRSIHAGPSTSSGTRPRRAPPRRLTPRRSSSLYSASRGSRTCVLADAPRSSRVVLSPCVRMHSGMRDEWRCFQVASYSSCHGAISA